MKSTLPDNSTDRLLAVADIIEFTPERWTQHNWFADPATPAHERATEVIGRGITCGTTGCIAGWAVALSSSRGVVASSWHSAGGHALGLSWELADDLFDGGLGNRMDHHEVADVLRRLAKLPEDERDVDGARTVLTESQLFALGAGLLVDEAEEDEEG